MAFSFSATPTVPSLSSPATFDTDTINIFDWMVNTLVPEIESGYNYYETYGLGTSTAATAPNNDLDDVQVTGWVIADSSTANRPGSTGNWVVQTICRTTSDKAQIAYSRTSGLRIWYRTENNSSGWSAWRRIDWTYATGANGSYMTGPHGILICWTNLGAATSTTWTYPAAFSGTPTTIVSPNSSGARSAVTQNRSATSIDVDLYDASGSAISTQAHCLAIGLAA